MSAPWGSGLYGIGYWEEGNQDVTVEFAAWGQGTWGAEAWGVGNVLSALTTNTNSVSIVIDNDVALTGEQLNSTVDTVSITADANLELSTNLLEISLGDEGSSADVSITLTTLDQLNTTIGSYSITADGNVTDIVVGDSINSTTGTITADGGASFEVTGNELNIAIGDEDLTGDATVTLSNVVSTVSVESVTVDLATVEPTGVSATTTVNSVSFQIDADVVVSGVNMTASTGRLYVSAWAVIDINSTATWTVVDIAA